MALGVLGACNNPFATRTPKPPFTGKIDLEEPTSATNVLRNFKTTLEHISSVDYIDLFAEDFIFVPDPDDQVTYDEVFPAPDAWNKDREAAFARNLFKTAILRSIELENWSIGDNPFLLESSSDDKEQTYEYVYSVTIQYSNQIFREDDSYPKSLRGTSWLFLREKGDGTWAIYRWEDQKADPETASWGGLRAKF